MRRSRIIPGPILKDPDPSARLTVPDKYLERVLIQLNIVDFDRLRSAVNSSIELTKSGEYRQALRLLDDAISEATRDGENRFVPTLCHHAAVICRSQRDLQTATHYYEQSLTCNPENPRALYGLAVVVFEEGQADRAKQYAARCYRSLLENDDYRFKTELLDLVLQLWPELANS